MISQLNNRAVRIERAWVPGHVRGQEIILRAGPQLDRLLKAGFVKEIRKRRTKKEMEESRR